MAESQNAVSREKALEALKPLNGEDHPSLLAAVFQSACLDITLSGVVRGVDEEAMTGALLGAMVAQVPWWAQLLSEDPPGCTWYRYRKSGGGADSETKTGGDVAFLIRMGDGRARLAIIQAKRPGGETARVLQVHRISPAIDGHDEEPQFVRLRRYGQSLVGVEDEVDLSKLHFVHYALYLGSGALTVSLDQLSAINAAYLNAVNSRGGPRVLAASETRVFVDSTQNVPLAVLLTLGCQPDEPARGWLCMADSDAGGVVEKLGAKVQVIEVSPSLNGLPLVNESGCEVIGVVLEPMKLSSNARAEMAGKWSESDGDAPEPTTQQKKRARRM
jgi:hypothetical protein